MDEKEAMIKLMTSSIDVINKNIPIELKESLVKSIKFRNELSKESDRGCALFAAAHIDFLLEIFLNTVYIGNKKHHDSLCECTFF